MLTSSAHRKEATKRLRAGPVAAAALTIAAAAAYSAISLYRHERFGSTVDLATQDQTIWGYSRLEMIPNTVIEIRNLLGDHFHPMLLALAPLYWVWNSPEVLLVAQGALLALAGVPIYLWAARQLGELAALAFQASYLLFWGILAGVLFDFHNVVLAVPAISAALYAMLERRNRLLWAMVAIALLAREDIALTLIALGLYVIAVQRTYVLGSAIAASSAAWFLLILGVVIPAIRGGPYRHWTYTDLGTGPSSAAIFVITHPLQSLELLFVPLAKSRIWIGTLASWLFLPVASPIALIAFPYLAERFWSVAPTFWTFHLEYSMVPAPILAFAAIDTVARAKRVFGGQVGKRAVAVASAGVVVAAALLSFLINPLDELRTYVSASTATDIQACLDIIPPGASVAATQELLAHLSHRHAIYQIPDDHDTTVEYIAIDLASDGNNEQQLRDLVRSALASGYGVACARELTVVLARRGATDQALPPRMVRWLNGECEGRACLA